MPIRTTAAVLACVSLVSITCGRDATELPVPTTLSVAPGTITLTALGLTRTLTATVRDQGGNVLDAQGIVWTSTKPLVATVNTSGVVTAVGNGTASIEARVGSARDTATVAVAQAVSALVVVSGDGQSGSAGTALPSPLIVRASDANGHPVPTANVDLSVTAGGGSLSAASQSTGGDGQIQGVTWTLGLTAGAVQQVAATVTGTAPVTFAATATPGTAAQIARNAGDGQSATVGSAVAIDPAVVVRDQFGNPVGGVAVTFTVAAGGGSVTGGNATTDAAGVAAVTSWTLGTVAGTANNTLQATAVGLAGSPLPFTATAVAGPAASVAVHLGDNQTGSAGAALPVDPAVIVRDAFANPTPGAVVTFAVTAGGGALTGPVDTTGSNGIAIVGDWILGAEGANQLAATVTGAGISGNPVTFSATATGGDFPWSVAVAQGDGQTGLVGFAVNVAPAVVVRDATGAPVSGVRVDFTVTGGGGSVTGASVMTGTDGVAQPASWILGAIPGPNALSAAVAAGGVTGNPVAFSATGSGKQYDIVLRFLSAASPGARQAFDSAEARWERLLYGELADVNLNRGPGSCAGVDVPAVHEVVDDLLIFVRIDSIDGRFNVLGRAGPCFIRGSDSLPVVGAMEFDSADVVYFVNQGLFDEIVMHEMGHVLGLGTLWALKGRLKNPSLSGGTDPFFDGAEGIAAFDRSGGAGYGGARVPVENTGGSGTADSHWRESVFDAELMTGFLDGGVANPMSVISVASMADLGYQLANYAGADAYVVASALLRVGGAPNITFGDDAYRGVVTFVDAQGRPLGIVRLRE